MSLPESSWRAHDMLIYSSLEFMDAATTPHSIPSLGYCGQFTLSRTYINQSIVDL